MLRCLRARQLAGLLALAALLGAAAAQDAAAAAATSAPAPPADFFEGRLINVCTSDYAPISRCLDREPAQYTGCVRVGLWRLRGRGCGCRFEPDSV